MILDKTKFSKLLAMLGSDNEAEVSNALRAADRMLKEHNINWTDIANGFNESDRKRHSLADAFDAVFNFDPDSVDAIKLRAHNLKEANILRLPKFYEYLTNKQRKLVREICNYGNSNVGPADKMQRSLHRGHRDYYDLKTMRAMADHAIILEYEAKVRKEYAARAALKRQQEKAQRARYGVNR